MTRTPLVVGLGDDLYAVERPWGELPPGMQLRDVFDVAVDAQDRVYVFQRTDPPIVIFDAHGAYVGGCGSGLLADTHGIFITADNHVLLADRDAHQVLQFDLEGKLELAPANLHWCSDELLECLQEYCHPAPPHEVLGEISTQRDFLRPAVGVFRTGANFNATTAIAATLQRVFAGVSLAIVAAMVAGG